MSDSQKWIDAIRKALVEADKEKKFVFLIHYSEASNAFPNGPHEKMSGLNKLNMEAFLNWLKQYGWIAELASDNTEIGYEFAPEIKLTKIGHSPAE